MNEKLLYYLSGEMTPEEEHLFLEELKNSPELMKEKTRYEQLIKDAHSAQISNEYFTGLIPALRSRLEKKQRSVYIVRWTSGIAVAVSAVLIAVLFLFNDKEKSFDEMMLEMDNSDISGLVKEMDVDISNSSGDQEIEDIYYKELDLNGDAKAIMQSELISDAEVYRTLTDVEAELIYAELLNKDLNGY